VWTNDRLNEMDAYIKPLFSYSKSGDEEILDMLNDDEESNEESNE
jgi:hypothetical protein